MSVKYSQTLAISIHSLPKEGDHTIIKLTLLGSEFQSTPSPRRETLLRG